MISNVFRRLYQDGFKKTTAFYGKAYAWRMSANFRQNQKRFAQMSRPAFVLYVLWDYLRFQMDKCVGWLEHTLIGRSGIPVSELQEYVIRLIRGDWLNKDSVVYAFGVSRHIETEEEWAEKLGCTVHLFDPTEPAIEFIASRPKDPKLPFDPVGVWTYTGVLKFYKDKRDWTKNLSVVNLYHSDSYVEAPCMTLADIMKKYGHDHIDLLKMDIEGSALPVLLHMLDATKIRPRQIVGSLERPHLTYGATVSEIFKVVRDKGRLFRVLEQNGYRVLTHHSAEFTAIRG